MRTDDRFAAPTPLHHLARALRARASVPSSEDPPAAILWTDPRGEWHRLVPAALSRIPELLVLGDDYRPDDRTGPAIWLRCVVDRAVDVPGLPGDVPPILYLPGVEREDLRAGEACPDAVRPLVELMYRGAPWHHPNGRSWSVRAFLTSKRGPGLDIARDAGTSEALLGALDQLAATPMDQLRRGRLDAAALNRMAGVRVDRDILRWMADPKGFRKSRGDGKWRAFRAECHRALDFDPAARDAVEAGALLGEAQGPWSDVWERFAEAPEAFGGIPEVLERSRPGGVLALEGRERWPELNDEDERRLRGALAGLRELPHDDACWKVAELEREHGPRRDWVWARLGRSPMARALEPLAQLAAAARSAIGGATPDDIAQVYAERGWPADAGAREALALADGEPVVADAVRHLLERWLDDSARAFQAAAAREPLPSAGAEPEVTAAEGECIVFVDGLRYELGRRLAERLESRGCRVSAGRRWAALPTVTATAKPAVTPVADAVRGDRLGADFRPTLHDPDDAAGSPAHPATAHRLRDAMATRGYQIVDGASAATGSGSGTLAIPLDRDARGWNETGRIDHHGHHHDAASFARLLDDELARLGDHITRLLDAGWRSVRIVTDHGWLLLPGGLPLVKLPSHLTESKWARCAVIQSGATPDVPRHPWHWNPGESFASPPGIACFSKRPEYAHGGISVQECLIPDIRVLSGATPEASATIVGVSWVRLRCHVTVDTRGGSVTADLRLGSASGDSVTLRSRPKPVGADGLASLVLADDEYEDADLVVVVLGADGGILAQQPTRRGA